jgi:hypothetical protein
MRPLIVAVLALMFSAVGCTNVAMTTQQAQDLAYMSGYASMAVYLIAQKPAVAKVQVFKLDVEMISSAVGTTPMTQQAAYTIVNNFVTANPSDPATNAMLQGLVPPMLVASESVIQEWIATQAAADQAKTVQLVFISALNGVDDACGAYLGSMAPPLVYPLPAPAATAAPVVAVPVGKGMRPMPADTPPTRKLGILWPLAGGVR